jgi:hypothetical protein
MRVKLLKDCEGPSGKLAAGEIVDTPKAHLLIELGVAEPVCHAAKEHAAMLAERKKNEEARRRRKHQANEQLEQATRRANFAAELGLSSSDVEAVFAAALDKPPDAAHAATDVEIKEQGARSKKRGTVP